jgi:hypothetical protein
MRIGYCKFHKFEIDDVYAESKECLCMPNTNRKCKYLKKYKTKEKFRYQPKHLRR